MMAISSSIAHPSTTNFAQHKSVQNPLYDDKAPTISQPRRFPPHPKPLKVWRVTLSPFSVNGLLDGEFRSITGTHHSF
jgi:hypothetical protein